MYYSCSFACLDIDTETIWFVCAHIYMSIYTPTRDYAGKIWEWIICRYLNLLNWIWNRDEWLFQKTNAFALDLQKSGHFKKNFIQMSIFCQKKKLLHQHFYSQELIDAKNKFWFNSRSSISLICASPEQMSG